LVRDAIVLEDTSPQDQALKAGFERSSIDLQADADSLSGLDENLYGGTTFIVFAPIRNTAGQSVGVLEMEYVPEKLEEIEGAIDSVMKIAGLIALFWFLISSGLILKVTQPARDS
jgi:hypothetical protein